MLSLLNDTIIEESILFLSSLRNDKKLTKEIFQISIEIQFGGLK